MLVYKGAPKGRQFFFYLYIFYNVLSVLRAELLHQVTLRNISIGKMFLVWPFRGSTLE